MISKLTTENYQLDEFLNAHAQYTNVRASIIERKSWNGSSKKADKASSGENIKRPPKSNNIIWGIVKLPFKAASFTFKKSKQAKEEKELKTQKKKIAEKTITKRQ